MLFRRSNIRDTVSLTMCLFSISSQQFSVYFSFDPLPPISFQFPVLFSPYSPYSYFLLAHNYLSPTTTVLRLFVPLSSPSLSSSLALYYHAPPHLDHGVFKLRISLYGSSCNYVFSASFSTLAILFLFIGIPKSEWETKK